MTGSTEAGGPQSLASVGYNLGEATDMAHV